MIIPQITHCVVIYTVHLTSRYFSGKYVYLPLTDEKLHVTVSLICYDVSFIDIAAPAFGSKDGILTR